MPKKATEAFHANFTSREDVIKEYHAPANALDNAMVYLAWYGYGSYDGSSLVLFKKDGKLYEVNGSHCSCYGLEDQWEPVETSWEALAMRNMDDSSDGSAEANTVLAELVKKNLRKKKEKQQ